MKKIFSVLMITMLMVSSLFSVTAFATSNEVSATANQQNKDGKGQPPKDMNNLVFGKITAISENSVTISVAEMKKPEDGNEKKFDGNPPEKPNNQTNDAAGKMDRQNLTEEQIAEMKKKMEEMTTLTGETKTIDISNATFGNDRGRGQNKSDNNSSNNSNNNQQTTKTYKDYAVGDYITIELTGENTNVAKQVGDMRPMGMGPRGQFGKDDKGNRPSENK
jgi:hypothetical protein